MITFPEAFESIVIFFIALFGVAFVILMPAWSAVQVFELVFAVLGI